MRPLIAVMSCHSFAHKVQAIRETWLKDVDTEKFDVRFFVGRNHKYCGAPMGDDLYCQNDTGKCTSHQYTGDFFHDKVQLDVADDYMAFPIKVQAMRRWAYERGYENVLKLDDDVYLVPSRLEVPAGDYVGRTRGPSGKFPAPYNSGFAYWMTRRAIEKTLDCPWNRDTAEDRWIANELLKKGIGCTPDYRYSVCWSQKNSISCKEPPLCDNDVIASCEFEPQMMHKVHKDFKEGRHSTQKKVPLPAGPLSRVNVMIKTMLRDGCLFSCIRGLEKNLPDVKIVVVDDGFSSKDKVTRYSELMFAGHECIWMPYDSGFGNKANEALKYMTGEYVLIGSDDFDFNNPIVRKAVLHMQSVLDHDQKVGVVSGHLNGRAYEFCWEESPGQLKEVAKYKEWRRTMDGVKYGIVDLTVNWSLIRRKLFDDGLRWDGGDVKIGGGEHAAFFMDVREMGWEVAVVEDARVHEFILRGNPNTKNWVHEYYPGLRGRARTPGRPCLKRRGIDKYILASGAEELS